MMKACSLGLAWLILGSGSLLRADAPDDGSPLFTRIAGPVSVPAEISDHVMFVNIMVNGHGPFRVMVDTGCSVSVVSPELAEAAGAMGDQTDDDPLMANNALDDPFAVEPVTLATVDLGGVRFEGVPALVTDSMGEFSLMGGGRVDGALGFSLFTELYLGLDFPNRRLLLGKTWPVNAPAVRASLPVVERKDVPFVQVRIQGRPVEVMIDTGANQALHLPEEIASPFRWKQNPRVGTLIAVFGEIQRERVGRLAGSLTLGDVRQVEPTVAISPGDASIGLRSLEHYCVIFSQAEDKVWLCSADSAPVPPTAERTDGLSIYSDTGGWRIAGVIPGSPAEAARLAVGSLITQIEQRPAASWTRDQLQHWIDSHESIALVVAGQAGDRALTLPVWDLVPK